MLEVPMSPMSYGKSLSRNGLHQNRIICPDVLVAPQSVSFNWATGSLRLQDLQTNFKLEDLLIFSL